MRRSLCALGLAALLAGCAIPESKPRIAPLGAEAVGIGVDDTAPAIQADWWRLFNDPQLDRLIAEATAGNPSLSAAMARLDRARAVLASRRAEDGPNVTLDAQGQVVRLSDRYTIPPDFGGTTRFIGIIDANFGWNLDLFGRQKAAIESARASSRAAELDVAAARLAIAGAVAQSYIELARAEAQAAVAEHAIHTRTEARRMIAARIRNQLASQLDAKSADTLLAQARQALVRAQAGRVLAANAIAALAGRGPNYAAAIGPAALRLDTELPLPTVIPADLLARRADIAAGRARIDAAAAGRQVARRAFYPNINLGAAVGLQAIGLGNLFDSDAAQIGGGPAVHLPLFDNGRLRGDLAGATAALDIATADYNQRVVDAAREAADAIARIGAAQADRAQQREVVRGFTETGRLNAIRVSSGLDSRLDLVDNEIRRLEAEQADINLAANAAIQRVALVLALGGGFDPAQDVTR